MPKVRVTFPHTDSNGRRRKVGEVYEVSADEATTRVDRDKFAVRVDTPSPTPRPAPNKKDAGK